MSDADEQELSWPAGELAKRLLARGLLTHENLNKAVALARETQVPIPDALIRLKLLGKKDTYEELAGLYGIPYVDLETYSSDPAVTSLIDEKTARDLEAFPLFAIGQSLAVALTHPDDIMATDRLAAESKLNIEPCLAVREDILDAINRAYGSGGEIKDFLSQMKEDSVPSTTSVEAQERAITNSESPVSRLVDLIIANAVRDRASDIHINREEHATRVRFRIDGVLYEVPPPPNYLFPFLVSRIKVMSNMDIAESRLPQDGHFRSTIDGQLIETRVSSVPTLYGESVAIRLLDTSQMTLSLEDLGMPSGLLPRVNDMTRRTHGMVVLTGPTGSGKSTTLYAMLSKAKSSERNIVTIEDPVERRLKLVSQIQINEKAGFSFASALRSILRQDPDVIMVGEVRDAETAQLAVRAALTGHLVLSTVHTNDAPGTVTRLVNMGIEPFLLSSSLVGAMAQRLARRICDDCRQPHEIPATLRQRLAASGLAVPGSVWRGAGCSHCRNTGYSRRVGVFELMPVTPALADLISANVPTSQIKSQARKDGMISMLEDGLAKVGKGITTLEEVLRIAELDMVVDSETPVAASTMEPARAEPAPEKAPTGGRIGLDLDEYKKTMASWLAAKPR